MAPPNEPLGRLSSTTVAVSSRAHSLEVIKKAAYRLLDRGVVSIDPDGEHVKCTIHFRTPLTPEDAQRIGEEFLAEILDQDLRELISQETSPVRNAILAHVFSKTGLRRDE